MAKTLSFACVHFVVAFTVGYLITGSIAIGGAVALIEPLCNTFAYHLHERAWAAIARRREQAAEREADVDNVGGEAVPA